MKRVAIGLLALFLAITVLESCSSKLCPAFNSYPTKRRR